MFIYADESGNTGRQIFQEPELYRMGSIFSVNDIEDHMRKIIEPLNEAAGRERLHAHQLTPAEAAEVARAVLEGLDAAGEWTFLYGEIEKTFMATTKFVDLVFDSGENLAVPPLWYNHQGFRHLLCLTSDDALRDRYRREFWDAFLKDDIAGIVRVIDRTDDFVRTRVSDKRINQICRDAFAYVRRHPDDFTLAAATGRRAYQGHTPNLVAFSFIFDAVHRFVDRTGSKPVAFIHDRQQEFGTSMKEWASLFGGLKRETVQGLPKIEMADYGLPQLMLPSSKDMFALQAVDLLLWTLGRTEAVLGPAQAHLVERIETYGISRMTSRGIVAEFAAEISGPLAASAEDRGRETLAVWERDRLDRIAARRRQG